MISHTHERHVKTEADIKEIGPHAIESQQPLETGRGEEKIDPQSPQEHSPASTLIQTSGLLEL